MLALVVVVVLAVLVAYALFWILRLAVRQGVNDALQMNRDWLSGAKRSSRDDSRP